MRLLIVDGHAVVRRGVQQVLSDAMADVRFGEASNASDGMMLLEREAWDLVIVDLRLPGRDGLSLLEEIRGRRPDVPILVLSAYPEEEFAIRSLRLGARGYVTKASATDELALAVRRVLQGGRYITEAVADKLASLVGADVALGSPEALSNRELQVLRLVASGRSLKQIAAELRLSPKTIATYRARIATKLQLSTNVELTRYAIQHRLAD